MEPDKVGSSQTPRKAKPSGDGGSSGKHRQGGRGSYKKPIIRQPRFEGKCEELKGHVYDCSDSRQADQYVKTTKEIAEYVGRTYKYGSDARLAVENLCPPAIPVPNDPAQGATMTEQRIWEKRVDECVKREVYLEENIKTIYSLVWGQCTDAMHARIEAMPNYKQMAQNGQGLELLQVIKDITYNFQAQKYLAHSVHEAKRRFYLLNQGKHLTTQAYLEQFQNTVDVVEHCGGTLGFEPGLFAQVCRDRGINGAFAVHNDMRSHTGGVMTLGRGAMYAMLTRQKLNMRSSTETELVAVDDVSPQIMWTMYFMEAQGYKIRNSIMYQDNESAILLEKNGRASSSKRTRHINIRYFFVKDRIASGEMEVQYCPTEEMIADFFTKPLQGGLFRKFRDWIMNVQVGPMIDESRDHRSVLDNDGWVTVRCRQGRRGKEKTSL